MKRPALLFLLFLICIEGSAQIVPDSLSKRIDALFGRWNNPTSPGCVIGVIRNDSLIYAKGYGMANLEYGIPNSSETIFHMASVSKQFTAYCIVLLAKQGRLNLDDDIHKYLPWVPDFKEKITVRQLLNHTSGIRDQWQLLAIAGTRLDDVITQDQIIKILSKQQALNSKPGERYNYSNSGFTMLSEIVKSVSGKSLRQFADSAIFIPLGMKNTHVHDDYTEIVKNRAYSYQRKNGSQFSNSVLSYSNSGATSLFTNINDLSKWVMNFYNPIVGEARLIEQLTEKGKLNNGKELNYALGIIVNQYKGWKQYTHNGSDAGFRTYLSVFPELKTGVIVFSNLGDFDFTKINAMTDLLIKENSSVKEEAKKPVADSSKAVLKDINSVQKYLGNYINDEGSQLTFEVVNGRLVYRMGIETRILVPERKDAFVSLDQPQFTYSFSITGKEKVVNITTPDRSYTMNKFNNSNPRTDEQLKKYTGTYYCAELDCNYSILLKDHGLYLTNPKYNDIKISMRGDDHLDTGYWWMSHLFVLKNNKNEISGFEVNTGRVIHLKFIKVK
ncbi:MAG: serine hydrolase domain-containing protein [Chitinophagaceae bacterium]